MCMLDSIMFCTDLNMLINKMYIRASYSSDLPLRRYCSLQRGLCVAEPDVL
jgi:hypothetical protein